MSLLHPTPGEVMDRMSIVELKIEAYRKSKKDTSRLTAEGRELSEYLTKFPDTHEIESLRNKLVTINLTLWKSEDEVRSCRDRMRLYEVALNIAKFNDRRSKVIREIDRNCGVESIEEKIYATGS